MKINDWGFERSLNIIPGNGWCLHSYYYAFAGVYLSYPPGQGIVVWSSSATYAGGDVVSADAWEQVMQIFFLSPFSLSLSLSPSFPLMLCV